MEIVAGIAVLIIIVWAVVSGSKKTKGSDNKSNDNNTSKKGK